ncbi:MAG: T9SS type A sorting domain-containing protein, partial [Bacteroidales bacterium]|nr:T9SS type A sorting domain-containing protein [Bacteroidales bacterium]
DSDNQLFGFVSKGYSDKSYKIQVVAKATGEALDLAAETSILTTSVTGKDWVLKHVFSTNNPEKPYQAVIKAHRYNAQPILTNTLSEAQPNWAKTLETYDNKYTWEFERIVTYDVTLTKDDQIEIQTPEGDSPYSVESGKPFVLTFTIAAGYEPVVKINDVEATDEQLTEEAGTYTLTIASVQEDFTVTITAKAEQTQEIAGGLITLSNATTEVWYYIGNGHSSDAAEKPINDSDGRFSSMITAPAVAGNVTYESILAGVIDRNAQKWKVVASPEDEYYYLINKDGKYLSYTATRLVTASEEPTESTQDSYMFAIARTAPNGETLSSWVTIKTKNVNYAGGLNQGSDFSIESNNATVPPAVLPNGLTGSPRAWLFTSAEVLDDFYPVIAPVGSETIGEWFRIKSLDTEIAGEAKYLTIDPETKSFSLAEKTDSDNQLFGFVSKGYSDKSYKIQVVAKATGESLDLAAETSILTTSATGKDWVLKHVFSTNNPDKPYQAVIRAHRYNAQPILTNTLSEAQPNWAKTLETYDNKYAWEFERTSFDINITAGEGVILQSPATASLKYGEQLSIVYQVEENAVPVVTVNNEPSPIGDLVNGTYTLNLTVRGTTTVSIIAESTLATVTVNAPEYVTIVSPVLNDDKEYLSPSTSTITFTLAEGYENPAITPTKAIAGDPSLSNNTYSVILTEVEDGAIVAITATLKSVAVATTKGEGVSWNQDPEENVIYGNDYTLSFTVDQTYHDPKVIVDGDFYDAVVNSGIYTVTLQEVKEPKTIHVGAFKANTIPVTADTWVRGGEAHAGVSNVNDRGLYAQYSTYNSPTYMRRSYMEFDATSMTATYDKVTLKLTVDALEKAPNLHMELRSAEELNSIAISDMTWTANEEMDAEPKGQVIGTTPIVIVRDEYPNKSVLEIDVTQYVLGKKDAPFRLQITGVSTSETDGYIRFYSDNGAAYEFDLKVMPVLEFTELVGLEGDIADQDVIVYPENQSLLIKTIVNCEVAVYSISGQLITKRNVEGTETVNLSKGLYIVKAGNKVYKFTL